MKIKEEDDQSGERHNGMMRVAGKRVIRDLR